jgi:hypothetical protein
MSKMSNWLKAGLIGAAAVVVLQLLGIIPCVGCVTWLLVYVAYGCIGALAAYWMAPRRLPGPAAGNGALAGLIAGAIGGAVGLIIALGVATFFVPLGLLGNASQGAPAGPSALWGTLASLIGSLTCATGCYAVGVAIAAGLGSLGGVIFAAIQPE